MAVSNPSFEDAGAMPGQAEHWTLITSVAGRRIAGFGPSPHRAWEDFERWCELLERFDDLAVVIARFGPARRRYENFEAGWNNDIYLFELPTGQLETAIFGGREVEDFESGWSNDPFAWRWSDVAGVTGVFGGGPFEDFEEGWRDNENYKWSWSAVASQTAGFDGGAKDREDFEGAWTPAATI